MPRERRIFHESYGDVTPAQLRCYREHNISPADHDQLIACFGDRPDAIVSFIVANPVNTAYHLMQLARR